MRAPALLAALALAAAPARASFTQADAGTSAAQFLKLGGGARAEGMGEAYSAVPDEADAIYWNPAALSRIQGHSATFMHEALPAGINYDFVGYGQNVGKRFGVGGSVQYLSQPAIDQTDSGGFPTGATFSPHDVALSAGGSVLLPAEGLGIFSGARIGVTGRWLQTTITRTGTSFAGDIGYLSAPVTVLGREVRVAYVAQNVGDTVKIQQTRDALPTTLRFGATVAAAQGLTFALDVDEPIDDHPYAAFGGEYAADVGGGASVSGRAGVMTRAAGISGSLSGLTFGVGLRLHAFRFDYALAPLGSLGLTQFASVGVAF